MRGVPSIFVFVLQDVFGSEFKTKVEVLIGASRKLQLPEGHDFVSIPLKPRLVMLQKRVHRFTLNMFNRSFFISVNYFSRSNNSQNRSSTLLKSSVNISTLFFIYRTRDLMKVCQAMTVLDFEGEVFRFPNTLVIK